MVNLFDPYTIAFGGVPTGIIKAQLAAKVKGIAICTISKPEVLANAATIGTKITTSARLDKIIINRRH